LLARPRALLIVFEDVHWCDPTTLEFLGRTVVAIGLVRWISRTPDQVCLAIMEPATCGIDGYSREKARGKIPRAASRAAPGPHKCASGISSREVDEMISPIDRLRGRCQRLGGEQT
jgi:hypothetical protein